MKHKPLKVTKFYEIKMFVNPKWHDGTLKSPTSFSMHYVLPCPLTTGLGKSNHRDSFESDQGRSLIQTKRVGNDFSEIGFEKPGRNFLKKRVFRNVRNWA